MHRTELVTLALLLLTVAADAAPLHDAAASGDVARVRKLLEKGADVNVRDDYGETPLFYAAGYGYTEVVSLLLAKGADVNATGRPGAPLHAAAINGQLGTARLLLDHGAAVDATGSNRKTPLHWAASGGQLEMVQLLLAHGADINAKADGGSAINSAAYYGWTEVITLLLASGATWEPLHRAAFSGKTEQLRDLLDRGADANAKDHGLTALACAALAGQLEAAKLLLDLGANVDGGNEPPLHYAALGGREAVAKLLVERGADVRVRVNGANFLQASAFAAQASMVEFFLDLGLEWSELHKAAFLGQADRVKALLARGSSVNAENYAGLTALHCAALAGQVEVGRLLLGKGANIEAEDRWHGTPLHYAAAGGSRAAAELLLNRRARVNARRWFDARTPLRLAEERGHAEVASMIRARGGTL